MCLILYSAVSICAQPRYTVTDLGAFQPTTIAGSWVVGSEQGVPVRLNLDTGHKDVLAHYGYGGIANDVNTTGWTVGTLR